MNDRTQLLNHRGKGPKNYRREDARIREEVCEALYLSSDIDAAEIEVSVLEGEVYLKGLVEDRRMKRLTEDLIEEISGVRDIHNELHTKVTPSFLGGLTGNARKAGGLVKNFTKMN